VGVLVGDSAADGGGVDANLFGDFLDHHRAQRFDALIEELLLAAHNHFTRPKDGALPLGDVAHQLHRRAETLLDVILDFLVGVFGG